MEDLCLPLVKNTSDELILYSTIVAPKERKKETGRAAGMFTFGKHQLFLSLFLPFMKKTSQYN